MSAVAGAAGVSDVRSLFSEREREILVFLYRVSSRAYNGDRPTEDTIP